MNIKKVFPDWNKIEPGEWSKNAQTIDYVSDGKKGRLNINLFREVCENKRFTLQISDGDEIIFQKDIEVLPNFMKYPYESHMDEYEIDAAHLYSLVKKMYDKDLFYLEEGHLGYDQLMLKEPYNMACSSDNTVYPCHKLTATGITNTMLDCLYMDNWDYVDGVFEGMEKYYESNEQDVAFLKDCIDRAQSLSNWLCEEDKERD